MANTLGMQPFIQSGAKDKIMLLDTLHHLAEAECFLFGRNFRNMTLSVLSNHFHPHQELSYGVRGITLAAEYIKSYVHDSERSCTKFRSGSHSILYSLWFWAGPHECSPVELSNSWAQGRRILWQHLDQWSIHTPSVELLRPQWAENNHVEGWHFWLKRIVGKPLIEIVNVIRKEQVTTETKLEQYTAGATQPSLERRYIQQDEICKLLLAWWK